MPKVSRSDCTEISATEFWKFDWNAADENFDASLDRAEIAFNACQGAGNRNNDLEAYYKKLVNQGKATQANLEKLQDILVGAGGRKCDAAIESFLGTQGIQLK